MCGEKALTHHGTGGGALGGPMCVGKARHVEPAERQRQGFLHIYGEGTNSQMLTTLAREVSSSIWGRHRIAGGCGLHFSGVGGFRGYVINDALKQIALAKLFYCC